MQNKQPQQQLLDKSSYSYVQFINALPSNRTKDSYTFFLDSFLRFANLGCNQILELEPRKVQGILISYIVDMREKQKQSPNSMKAKVAAVKTFFEMNDYMEVNWRKVRKYLGEFYRVVEDRPYTREEIKKLVDTAHNLRDKAIILLLASSGIRRGAIPDLKIKHLKKIDKYNIFVIDVYKQAREHYYTFCTPEFRRAIEDYLDWRTRLGERLTLESPLFRKDFDTRFGVGANILPISYGAIIQMIKGLRNAANIVPSKPLTENVKSGSPRTEVAGSHGFRKFFDTICTNGGMESLFVEIVMGHDIGLERSYYKPTLNEILEGNNRMRGYVSVINDLTINDEHRLRDENTNLKQTLAEWAENRKEMAKLQKRLDEIDRAMGATKASIDN